MAVKIYLCNAYFDAVFNILLCTNIYLSNIYRQQDFDIEYFRDVPRVFAQLVPEMMRPLQEAASSLATYFEDPTTKAPISAYALFCIFVSLCFTVCILAYRLGYLPVQNSGRFRQTGCGKEVVGAVFRIGRYFKSHAPSKAKQEQHDEKL